jgi:hypothetical protein
VVQVILFALRLWQVGQGMEERERIRIHGNNIESREPWANRSSVHVRVTRRKARRARLTGRNSLNRSPPVGDAGESEQIRHVKLPGNTAERRREVRVLREESSGIGAQ